LISRSAVHRRRLSGNDDEFPESAAEYPKSLSPALPAFRDACAARRVRIIHYNVVANLKPKSAHVMSR